MRFSFEFQPQRAIRVAQSSVTPALSVLRFESGVFWNLGLCFVRSGSDFQPQHSIRVVQ